VACSAGIAAATLPAKMKKIKTHKPILGNLTIPNSSTQTMAQFAGDLGKTKFTQLVQTERKNTYFVNGNWFTGTASRGASNHFAVNRITANAGE
jgi:hypothetical protein